MAKVKVEFDSIEDKDEMEWCLNGRKWWVVCWDLDQYFRQRLKYETNITNEAYDAVEAAREKLRELMQEEGLKFD